MKNMDWLIIAVIGFAAYEYLKTNNPALLHSFGLGELANLPYPEMIGGNAGYSGIGRVYLSGMGGLGTIGRGYNINTQVGGDASRYEKARKFSL